jgi:hypothetical protein
MLLLIDQEYIKYCDHNEPSSSEAFYLNFVMYIKYNSYNFFEGSIFEEIAPDLPVLKLVSSGKPTPVLLTQSQFTLNC